MINSILKLFGNLLCQFAWPSVPSMTTRTDETPLSGFLSNGSILPTESRSTVLRNLFDHLLGFRSSSSWKVRFPYIYFYRNDAWSNLHQLICTLFSSVSLGYEYQHTFCLLPLFSFSYWSKVKLYPLLSQLFDFLSTIDRWALTTITNLSVGS